MLIQRVFQTVLISSLVAFAVPAVASPALPLCGDEKAEKDESKKGDAKDQTAEEKKKDDNKKNAKKGDSDAPA